MVDGDVTVGFTSPKAKAGAYFDGVNDKVTFTPIVLTQFTVSLWVKTISFPGGSWGMFMGDAGDYLGKLSAAAGNAIRMELNGVTSVFGAPVMALREWHHFIYWSNGVITRAYYDGVQSGADEANVQPLTLDMIGKGQANFHNAAISDVKIWNRPLTPAECLAVYNGDVTRTGLAAEYLLKDDYTDSAGTNDGTNNGSRLGIYEEDIAAVIKAARTSANDRQMIATGAEGQIINVDINE